MYTLHVYCKGGKQRKNSIELFKKEKRLFKILIKQIEINFKVYVATLQIKFKYF